MKIYVGPFYNWISVTALNYCFSMTIGRHSNKMFDFWKSSRGNKWTWSSKVFHIALSRMDKK